jgi:predicted HNH restriction endonuclease
VNRRDEQAFHVHHIVSFQVAELRAVVSNLALLCAACHRWVHSAANVDRAFLPDEEVTAA